jgi:hypothetical protein
VQEQCRTAANDGTGYRRQHQPLHHSGQHDEGLDVVESLHRASY